MDLDDHARRAADALRHQATNDLDLLGAADRVTAAGRRRTTRRRQARIGVVAVVGLAVIGALSVAVVHDGPTDDRAGPDLETDRSTTSIPDATTTEPMRSEQDILAALPSGPLDGKDSWRLPVTASPQTDLTDGQQITVIGRGFEPHERLAIVQCGTQANTGEAANACSLGTSGNQFAYVTYADADADGGVIGQVEVRRTIDTPIGQIDCASGAERCILGIGALANYDRSGSTYVDFEGAPGFATPSLSVSPSTELTPHQSVTLTATDLVPHRRMVAYRCDERRCVGIAPPDGDVRLTVGADGSLSAALALDGGFTEALPCSAECRIELRYADGPGTTAPEPTPVPLSYAVDGGGDEPAGGFTPGSTTTTDGPAPTTTAPTATTTATTAPRSPTSTSVVAPTTDP